MFLPIVLATVCLASSQVLAAYDKPYYEVEDAENLFKEFVKEHKKVYNRREYFERLEIFKENLKDINERNAIFPDTVFAVNHFADLKPNERKMYSGFKPLNESISIPQIKIGGPDAPDSFDWRDHSAVTPVKYQGPCGSCYIFSAVGQIEGHYALHHKQCFAFSEGQCLDCLEYGSCGGGWMHEVMQELAIKKIKLEKEEDYPYKPKKNTCHEDPSKGIARVVRGGDIMVALDEDSLKKKLVRFGPLAIALDSWDLGAYEKGILEPHWCENKLDHGVLLVGYGEEGGKKFWIIKNSWGTNWGEKGYVRLLRGVNACGIGLYVAFSVVAQ